MEVIAYALNVGSGLNSYRKFTEVGFIMQEDESDDGEAEEKERFLSFPFYSDYYRLLLSTVLYLYFLAFVYSGMLDRSVNKL